MTPGYQSIEMDTLDPVFRVKVETVIKNLEKKGYKPIIWATYRSDKQQQFYYDMSQIGKSIQLFLLGTAGPGYTNAKAGQSCHNHNNSRGEPSSYAVDIIGYELWGWLYLSKRNQKKHVAFFRDLAKEAKALNLNWGGDFGENNIWKHHKIGWDPKHISDKRCKYK